MREALCFKNISFSVKLDSEADVSKYGQIRPHIRRPYPAGAGYENMAGFRPRSDMISGATIDKSQTLIFTKPR